MIVQVSVKTIRHWGFKPIATWVRMLAEGVDVPVALHLDHCSDVEVIKGCIDAGWTSVMFDGSALPFAENRQKSEAVYKITEAAGVGLGKLAQPLRAALTGRTVSPGIFDVLLLLGRDASLARLDAVQHYPAGA